MSDEPTPPPEAQKKSGFGGLIAILIGIVAGVLLGLVYGRAMWVAGSGPEQDLQRLHATIQQKGAFAERYEKQAEAENLPAAQRQRLLKEARRLRSHIPEIQARIDELERAEDQQASGLALLAWKMTDFLGGLFLQVLKLLVIPLVVTSMICGITALGDVRKLGNIGIMTVGYYLSTAGVAVFTGIVLVLVIKPGINADDTFAFVSENVLAKENATVLDTVLNVFRGQEGEPGSGMFPENIFEAAASTNVLGLLTFAIIFGAVLTTLGEQGRPVIEFFRSANEAVMKMVHLVMYTAPVGIFALVAFNIAKNGGAEAFGVELRRLSWYTLTVIVGLSIHSIFLATLLKLFTGRNPLTYTLGILRALLTSLSTASSSATLPITMECVEQNNGVSNRAASFVLPLGATVNMDGTALYEAVAVIFIAQRAGIPLPLGILVVIFLTATLAAIGAAGIPEAGLVTMVIVLTAAGLPTSGIGTILAIDWFLDRLRTTVNVYGDAIGSGIIDHHT